MSTATIPLSPARRAFNPWIVAGAVIIPTFMEVLDTTIANVALRYIAGGLSAAVTDSEWVITSYLAANAVVLPISGWLAAHFGRRNYFLASIAIFTLASALCGFATSLEQIILFRIIQGLAGGGLQPSSQGVLLDAFPPEKQGAAQSMFGLAAVIAPIIGPTLGGWFCVNYDWRWIFLINVPIGLVALGMSYVLVQDPDYLIEQRKGLRGKPLNFDFVGLGLLVLVMASWEVLLSKGQEWDWLDDSFGRIQTLTFTFTLGLLILVVWEMRNAAPLINFRVLGERNLAISCLILFSAFAFLYGASVTVPALLQALFGYDALQAGLVLSPGGITSVSALVIVGILLGRGLDARWLIAAGLLTMAASNYWMSQMNLEVGPRQVVGPRMVLTAGLGLIFAPLSVAAYKYTPVHLRGAAVGLASLLRNEGGSVGISLAQTFQQRRQQFHVARVNEFIDVNNPQVTDFLEQAKLAYYQNTGDMALASNQALQTLDDLRQQQASSLAYFDVFWLGAVLGVVLVFLVPLMKRSVAEKGEHLAAE